ncbi:MAG: Crp/Fnr family transcriptional regulator, partial [Candidatus Angelobacter sp.]
ISNFEVIGKLRTRTESSRWFENFFPISDGHGKVKKVGVVIIEAARPLFASADDKWLRQADAQWAYQEQCPLPANTVPELFRNLDKASLDVLFRLARRCTRYHGEVFCQQGEQASHVYLLLDGLVKVGGITHAGQEVLLDWMQAGDAFGLSTLPSPPAEYLWNVSSVANTEALEWDGPIIRRFAGSCPKFHDNALRIALRWAQQLQERFESLSTKTVEQRLADSVVSLAERFQGRGPAEIRLSDLELAQMTGTNLYTVNKIIHSWQRLGYVNKSRKRLIILDCASLHRISRS